MSPIASSYAERLEKKFTGKVPNTRTNAESSNSAVNEEEIEELRARQLKPSYGTDRRPSVAELAAHENSEEYPPANILRPIMKPRNYRPWYNYRLPARLEADSRYQKSDTSSGNL